jgi:hypothetical protein
MATKTFHVELRVANIDTPERMLAVRQALQNVGRSLHAKVMLICGDDPEPEILLYGEDLTTGRDDISIQPDPL